VGQTPGPRTGPRPTPPSACSVTENLCAWRRAGPGGPARTGGSAPQKLNLLKAVRLKGEGIRPGSCRLNIASQIIVCPLSCGRGSVTASHWGARAETNDVAFNFIHGLPGGDFEHRKERYPTPPGESQQRQLEFGRHWAGTGLGKRAPSAASIPEPSLAQFSATREHLVLTR
jgi:hypothetical protein